MNRSVARPLAASAFAALGIAVLFLLVFGPMALGGHFLEILGVKRHHAMRSPAMAKNVDFDWPGNWSGNPQWNAVLSNCFPAGSDENGLRSVLPWDAFSILIGNGAP